MQSTAIATDKTALRLSDACARCGITLRRAMFAAAFIDLGASSNINPLQCEKPDGKLADHNFQPRPA